MSIIASYFSMLIFFIFAEMIVLTNIMQPLFKKHITFNERRHRLFNSCNFLFYICCRSFWFTRAGIKSESYLVAIFSGAFLGLLAFGTYEITNFVILKDWKIELVIIDTLWGIIITGSMAYVGYKVYNFFQ